MLFCEVSSCAVPGLALVWPLKTCEKLDKPLLMSAFRSWLNKLLVAEEERPCCVKVWLSEVTRLTRSVSSLERACSMSLRALSINALLFSALASLEFTVIILLSFAGCLSSSGLTRGSIAIIHSVCAHGAWMDLRVKPEDDNCKGGYVV